MQAAFVWSKSTAPRRVGSFCRPCTTQPNLRAVPGMGRFIASGNHAKDKSKKSANPSPPPAPPRRPATPVVFIASGNHAKDKSEKSTNPSLPSVTPNRPPHDGFVFSPLGTPLRRQTPKIDET